MLIICSVLEASVVHGILSDTEVVKVRQTRSLNPFQPLPYRGAPANYFGPRYPPSNKPYNARPYSAVYPGPFLPQGMGSAYQYRPSKAVPSSSKYVERPKPVATPDNFPPGHTFTVTVTRPELPDNLKEAEPTSFTVLEQLAPAPPQFQQIEVSEAKLLHPYAVYPHRYRARY